jgi:hypothetical protein
MIRKNHKDFSRARGSVSNHSVSLSRLVEKRCYALLTRLIRDRLLEVDLGSFED